jgi:hypothetical protein
MYRVLTWNDGPILFFTPTRLGVQLSHADEEQLLVGVPGILHGSWLNRRVWLRSLYGPHALQTVQLRIEPGYLVLLRGDREYRWSLPAEMAEEAGVFIDNFRQLKSTRAHHYVTESARGQSRLPFLIIMAGITWFIRRRVRR